MVFFIGDSVNYEQELKSFTQALKQNKWLDDKCITKNKRLWSKSRSNGGNNVICNCFIILMAN